MYSDIPHRREDVPPAMLLIGCIGATFISLVIALLIFEFKNWCLNLRRLKR